MSLARRFQKLNFNKKKIIFYILIIFFISICINKKVYSVVSKTQDFYVNDYAGLLSKETEDYIININKSLCDKTGAQIVVVTVKNLEGNSLEEYATELFRKFGIGDRTKNNGVLLLLALEERQFRIEVGYGLEGVLTDGKTGGIQDKYIIPYLKQDNWDEGVRNGFNAILDIVSNEYCIKIDNAEQAKESGTTSQEYEMICIFPSTMISLIVGSKLKQMKKRKIVLYVTYFAVITLIGMFIIKSLEMRIAFILFNLFALIFSNSGHGGYRWRILWWFFRR